MGHRIPVGLRGLIRVALRQQCDSLVVVEQRIVGVEREGGIDICQRLTVAARLVLRDGQQQAVGCQVVQQQLVAQPEVVGLL